MPSVGSSTASGVPLRRFLSAFPLTMSLAAAAQSECRYCGLLYSKEEGRVHGKFFECTSCATLEKQMRRNLGARPEGMKHWTAEETAGFFRQCMEKKKADGDQSRMQWKTVRAALITVLTTRYVQKWSTEIKGRFLPLSVYTTQGWDKETVERCSKEWSDELACWTYKVPVKSLSFEETQMRVEESILQQEKEVLKKKGKDPAGDMDVPEGPGGKDTEKAAKGHTKVLRQNEQISALAGRGLGAFLKPLSALERVTDRVSADADIDEPVKRTFADLKTTLANHCGAARACLDEHEKQKKADPDQMSLLTALPFEAGDLKALPKTVTEVLKAVRPKKKEAPSDTAAAEAKAAALPASKGLEPKPKKRAAQAKAEPEPGKRQRVSGKKPEKPGK